MASPRTSTTRIFKRLNQAAALLPSVPIERLLKKHLSDFEELRALGLKWKAIALGLSEWRIAENKRITADHLRTAFSRVSRNVSQDATIKADKALPPPAEPTHELKPACAGAETSEKPAAERRSPAFGENTGLLGALRATAKLRRDLED